MLRRCTACGYDLAGIPAAAPGCPECGTRWAEMPKERAGGTRVMASACGPTMGACAAAIAGAVLVSNRLITNDFTVVVPVLGTLMLAAAGLGLFAPPVAVRRHAPGVRGRPRPDPQLTCVGAWFLNGLIWFLSATAVFGLLHLGPC